MINIGICDDDRVIIGIIKKYVENYFIECENKPISIKTFNSGENLVNQEGSFQIIFLDIDMGGINGIETAKRIRQFDKKVKIIYVTSFKDYTNLAFKVRAFGYINKPIKKEDIYNHLKEAMEYIEAEEKEEVLEFITTDGVVRLSTKEIYYFEYMNRTVKMKTLGKSYLIKEKITTIAELMSKYDFLMPHKSFTVNLFHVKSIRGCDITMMDGSIVPLSQKKSSEFRDSLNIYLEKHILKL